MAQGQILAPIIVSRPAVGGSPTVGYTCSAQNAASCNWSSTVPAGYHAACIIMGNTAWGSISDGSPGNSWNFVANNGGSGVQVAGIYTSTFTTSSSTVSGAGGSATEFVCIAWSGGVGGNDGSPGFGSTDGGVASSVSATDNPTAAGRIQLCGAAAYTGSVTITPDMSFTVISSSIGNAAGGYKTLASSGSTTETWSATPSNGLTDIGCVPLK